MKNTFPFNEIVGQDQLKTALLLIAIDPAIGGLLISGPRGSAKSTAVRALSDLVPDRPFINIPLGASEEMISGSLDLEHALNESGVRFQAGLLAKADKGMLYVDEVNLLADHLVDLLLDVSASGINIVERDGVSHQHSANFSLVGTMNPDEGELRPQLLDRFGIMVEMSSSYSLDERQQIVNKRLEYECDPQAFVEVNQECLQEIRESVTRAKDSLKNVTASAEMCKSIALRCSDANVEGVRADIVMRRASIAHAALNQRQVVTTEDLDAVEELVLCHRRRSNPGRNRNPDGGSSEDPSNSSSGEDSEKSSAAGNNKSSIQGSWGATQTAHIETQADRFLTEAHSQNLIRIALSAENSGQRGTGGFRSRRFIHQSKTQFTKVDWFRSLPKLKTGFDNPYSKDNLVFHHADTGKIELDLILLDTSASTLSGQGLGHAKGVISVLSRRGYLKRRYLGLITFGNNEVKTELFPQRSPKNIGPLLDNIMAGGGTPILPALDAANNLLRRKQVRLMDSNLYLITDGRIDESAKNHDLWKSHVSTVVDIESGNVKLGMGKIFARDVHANYLHFSSLPTTPLH